MQSHEAAKAASTSPCASDPPLPVENARSGKLRLRELTDFVGRREELALLEELVAKATPLITLVGPAGIGKTRLTRRFLQQRAANEDVFCDLRGINTAAGLVATLAETLDGHLENGGDLGALVDAIGKVLASRGCGLVVLDNFEQLVPAGIKPLHRWACIVPESTFIVTSRRMLHLRGERVHELAPLGLPSPEGSESDSTRLFIDRARAAEPAFDAEAKTAIDALVTRLEGIPLALELAAGQMRHFRPEELLQRLQASPAITLQADEHGVDPRHASLKSAIENSWRLLEPFQQSALSQLTACRQGFTLEAAEAIVDLSDYPEAPPIRAVVTALREATLLRVDDRVSSPAPLRWDMYESIWEFAASLPRGAAPDRHAAYFLARSKEWVGELGSPEERSARSTLKQEMGNLQVAFEHLANTHDSPDSDAVAELALVLYKTHRLSRPALAVSPLTTALDRVDDDALRTRLSTARGVCFRRIGDPNRAHADFGAARRSGRQSPLLGAELDLEEAILVLQAGAMGQDSWKGDVQQVRLLLHRAVDGAQRCDSPWLEARARTYLALVLSQRCQDPEARSEFARAFRLAERAGDAHGQALNRTMAAVCECSQQRGQPTEELKALIAEARAREDRVVELVAEHALGIIYLDSGELPASRQHLLRALEVSQTNGLHRYEAHTETWLAAVMEAEGSPLDLDRRYRRTAEALRAIGDRRCEAFAALGMSAQAAHEGDLDRAEELLDRGEQTGNRFGDASMGLVAELQRARVELVQSRRASRDGDSAKARRLRNRAVQRARAARRQFPPEASDSQQRPSLLGRSPEARWAWRLLQRELGENQPEYPRLRVWPDGSAFQLGRQPVVRLPNGPMIRAVMRTLAQERAEAPGRAISVRGFMRRCWGDEKISPEVGSQRLRTIVARLRKTGLAEVLQRDEAGYLLAPDANFAWADPSDRSRPQC